MISRISDKLSLHTNSSRVLAQQPQVQPQTQPSAPSTPTTPSSFVPSADYASTHRSSSMASSVPSQLPTSPQKHKSANASTSNPNTHQHVANMVKPLPTVQSVADNHGVVIDVSSRPQQQQGHQSVPSASQPNPITFQPTQPSSTPTSTGGSTQKKAGSRYALGDFIIHRTLGTGSFGRVHLGECPFILLQSSHPVVSLPCNCTRVQSDRSTTCATMPSRSLPRRRSTG